MPFVHPLQLPPGEVDFEQEHSEVGSVRVDQLVKQSLSDSVLSRSRADAS
jgi:hypothetical protein